MIQENSAVSTSLNVISGGKLRPGDIVSAKIVEILPGSRFRISLGTRTITAESHLHLTKGQVIRAAVERSGSGTILRIMDSRQGPADSGSGNSFTMTRSLLTNAFLKTAIALPGEGEIQRMSALLHRSKGSKVRLARLQADLVARGADPSADFLEALEELLGGEDEDNDSGRSPGRRWPEVPDPDELKDELQNEEQEDLLRLINSSPSRGESWWYQRFSRDLDGRKLSMTWKIRKGGKPGMALTVKDSGRTFEFSLVGRNPVRMTVFSDSGEKIGAEKWTSFRKSLSLKNIHVDDTIFPIEASDGFERA